MSKLPDYLARAELQRSEWKIMRAIERQVASPEWCSWRDELRRLVAMPEGFDAIPLEPHFGVAVSRVTEPEQAKAPILPALAEPENHFADLMLADETIDDARARISQRLRELRHYLIAPEIKVNEDGSVGLTPAEQAELQDLERRQTLGRWLEA
jgi:hypothetical protein